MPSIGWSLANIDACARIRSRDARLNARTPALFAIRTADDEAQGQIYRRSLRVIVFANTGFVSL